MKWVFAGFVVGYLLVGITCIADVFFPNPEWSFTPEHCDPNRGKGRIEWILLQRQPDYGWGRYTHWANIAIAVHGRDGTDITDEDMRKMGLQLEGEVAEALFRNNTSKMHANDLALYIHALLATNRDPRNFHGNDLVADLLHRVEPLSDIHPFLVLALCNAKAVHFSHLEKIEHYAEHDHSSEGAVDFRRLELKALALKAFACADSLPHQSSVLKKFRHRMQTAVECLIMRQDKTDGRFGNVYTTSLAVQALTAADDLVQQLVSQNKIPQWNEDKALKFLETEAYINVNMIKAYYIEMALHARKYNFIKDIYNIDPRAPGPVRDDRSYMQYTIRNSPNPDHFFTLTLKVEPNWNFFDVMKMAADLSDSFRFSYYNDDSNRPVIYAVAGQPNDAEENMFWRVCRQYNTTHQSRHSTIIENAYGSPIRIIPRPEEHIFLCYRNSECPSST